MRRHWLALLAPAWIGASAAGACGSDAAGIEACRIIEYARCDAVQSCANADYTPPAVDDCKAFYRDQCLHGVENADRKTAPQNSEAEACAAAVAAVAACQQAGKPTMAECDASLLVPEASTALSPCEIIRNQTHLLAACAFVATPPTTAATGTGGGGGAGGGTTTATTTAATTSSTGSSTTGTTASSSATTSAATTGTGGAGGGTGGSGGTAGGGGA